MGNREKKGQKGEQLLKNKKTQRIINEERNKVIRGNRERVKIKNEKKFESWRNVCQGNKRIHSIRKHTITIVIISLCVQIKNT